MNQVTFDPLSRCGVDRHALSGQPRPPGGAAEAGHPEGQRGGHDGGPPGSRLHAPRPGPPAGLRRARCRGVPGGQLDMNMEIRIILLMLAMELCLDSRY